MDAAAALVELDILIQFSAGYKGGFPNFDVLRKVLVANGSSDFDQMAQSFSIIVTLVCNIKEICHGVVDHRSIAAMDASIKVMQVACMRFGEISIADHIAPLTGAICHTFMKVVHYEIIERGISATVKDGGNRLVGGPTGDRSVDGELRPRRSVLRRVACRLQE